MSGNVIYEQPLNERIRTLLRLEQLMARFTHHAGIDSPWDSHCAITTLLEIFSLTTRGDLKNDLMKELDRQIVMLSRLDEDPDVDQDRLDGIVERQRGLIDRLHAMTGQLGQHLKNNDFLNAIRQRAALPGGSCDFDLPAYHQWLTRSWEERSTQLNNWIEPYEQVTEAANLILELIRESVPWHSEKAPHGFYQQALDPSQPFQMLRVRLSNEDRVYPEISAGKHRFSVRFLTQEDLDSRARQITVDVDFQIRCCAL